MNRYLVVIILVAAGAHHSATCAGLHSITCEHSTTSLSCKTGYIYVYAANYGRTEYHVCPHPQRSNRNCVSPNALKSIQLTCQGRTSCSVDATNNVFGDPCPGTYKYLSVYYICQPFDRPPLFHKKLICEGHNTLLSCGAKTIEILQANYGRTEYHPCPNPLRSDLGCRSEKWSNLVASRLCSNRRSCLLSANNRVFGDPCHGTYKYLDVVYRCV